MAPGLRALIAEELGRPAGPEAEAMAARLAARAGVVAVLFYGARLREGAGEGPLDFYLLTDSNTAYHGFGLPALANRLLPPNVSPSYSRRSAGMRRRSDYDPKPPFSTVEYVVRNSKL